MAVPPEWLARFADSVASLLHSPDALAPVGCHFCCVDDCWEVTLFVSRTQIVGGPLDGQETSSRFVVDLEQLLDCFAAVVSFRWQALPMGGHDELGAHVSVHGIVEDEQVRLRLLAKPPKHVPAGRVADAYEGCFHDLW
jgi:hypothetical protein